jgi:hypothetical protein
LAEAEIKELHAPPCCLCADNNSHDEVYHIEDQAECFIAKSRR